MVQLIRTRTFPAGYALTCKASACVHIKSVDISRPGGRSLLPEGSRVSLGLRTLSDPVQAGASSTAWLGQQLCAHSLQSLPLALPVLPRPVFDHHTSWAFPQLPLRPLKLRRPKASLIIFLQPTSLCVLSPSLWCRHPIKQTGKDVAIFDFPLSVSHSSSFPCSLTGRKTATSRHGLSALHLHSFSHLAYFPLPLLLPWARPSPLSPTLQ